MKIVQVNTVCGRGSVGRIILDLYETSQKSGEQPYIAYGRDSAPEEIKSYKIGTKSDFYRHVLRNFVRGEAGFGSQGTTERFIEWLKKIRPDVLHLHNIHGFYLQVEVLFDYIKQEKIPVIWTLHDCWPFTGHCAYFDYYQCDKWKTGCDRCKQHAKVYPYALFKDNAGNSYIRKKQAFTGISNLTVVSPSKWLAGLVSQSFLQEYPVQVIYNGIDLERFTCEPGTDNKAVAQADKHKKIILGVANVWEKRKGLSFFEQLAEHLDDSYQIKLVGVSQKQKRRLSKIYSPEKLLPIERTDSVEVLAELYREALIYVNPTLEDNFPTTNLEALACGTPVITFATGGSGESVDETCGLVVEKGNFEALLQAIRNMEKIIGDGNMRFSGEACRKRAADFRKEDRFLEYIELYRRVGIPFFPNLL